MCVYSIKNGHKWIGTVTTTFTNLSIVIAGAVK